LLIFISLIENDYQFKEFLEDVKNKILLTVQLSNPIKRIHGFI